MRGLDNRKQEGGSANGINRIKRLKEKGGNQNAERKGETMYRMRGRISDGREEDSERFSVMSFDIKHGSSSLNLEVLSSRCRDVRSVGNTSLINTLSSLDDLIQP